MKFMLLYKRQQNFLRDISLRKAEFQECLSKVRSENLPRKLTFEKRCLLIFLIMFNGANSPETVSKLMVSCYNANACLHMATDFVIYQARDRQLVSLYS